MPCLEKILVSSFRNIEFQELELSPNLNCISGNNGEGKTNLLDAVWYLSMTKSAFSGGDRYNFRFGTQEFSLCGHYRMANGLKSCFSVKVSADGTKKFLRDDKPYQKISEHIGVLPVVMVSPSDTCLVSESGEERRRFVNSVVSQMDSGYLSAIQQYNRLLAQRNTMLKENNPDLSLMEVIDMRLSAFAAPVHEHRAEFARKLSPVVGEYYRMLSGGGEEVGVEYRSDLDEMTMEDCLLRSRDRDRMMKYTTCGIQRDDFLFSMNGHPMRRCGSQGQQKSFLVALKLAQYDIMKESYGFAPMLLLDDVFDKLDMERISHLLEMVSGSDFGQIFITDSNKVRMASLVDRITSDRAYFEAAGGTFRRE
ncbi:MAG: DNA replication and repair protein RecF [Bacteroidales bacterium]|nr:DNA replication and repair protein RecF [Bacteroidales bacterium]